MFPNDGIPVLLGTRHEGQFIVWCPYCRIFHHHSPEAGHRAAHCSVNSPYFKSGYYVADFKEYFLELIEAFQREL